MRVLAYPADETGCGYHRIIWPCQVLAAQGYDVEVVAKSQRDLSMSFQGDKIVKLSVPDDVDVFVFQRITDGRMVQALQWLRERGKTVVLDVDDDLSAIDPRNPAYQMLNPTSRAHLEARQLVLEKRLHPDRISMFVRQRVPQLHHSWQNVARVAKIVSLVTVSTPGLLQRYANHGRGVVVRNYLADHYFDVEHTDSDWVVWPAALHSHPGDPEILGTSLLRLVQEGARFATIEQEADLVARAFRLNIEDVGLLPSTDVFMWPALVAQVGVGVVPLQDTLFNQRKSWLKGLELAACGAPFVASPTTEYRELNRLGAGILAAKPRDWYRIVKRLITDDAYRQDVGRANRAAAEKLRLVDHAHQWWSAWERAYAVDHPQTTSVA